MTAHRELDGEALPDLNWARIRPTVAKLRAQKRWRDDSSPDAALRNAGVGS